MTPARILLALVPAALLAALVMLALAALHSPALIRYYPVLLALNIAGIALLSGVMVYGAWRLALHLRARRPGARLTLRMLAAFGALALAPLVVVYFFSVQFVNRGIDSWFDVRIEEALNKASLLRRNTLEALRRDLVEQAAADAAALAQTPLSPDAATVRL
ncbi:MAG: two-component sensor histidine kinase, partial [Gammaproteobacteria bacterium]|nr:two-component sensor histidine kinase [Gammaproteobacteria bacterium]